MFIVHFGGLHSKLHSQSWTSIINSKLLVMFMKAVKKELIENSQKNIARLQQPILIKVHNSRKWAMLNAHR